MLNQDYTTKLLDLEEVIIKNVEKDAQSLHIHIELPKKEHHCPNCNTATSRIHDYRIQVIKDIPLGKKTILYLRKRRYGCPCCGKRFYEDNSFLGRYRRATKRMISAVIEHFRKLCPASEIASTYNISTTTALRYFDAVNYGVTKLPEVLSIDEFKGNAAGQKYQTILTNPKDKTVFDILPNRYESDLIRYFNGCFEREKVKYFVTDMNPHFRNVARICFPQAKIIADRFHVIRQAVWAMERVRKNEQQRLSDRFRKYFKHSKYLLKKPIDRLTDEEKDRLALMLEISPKLAEAYRLKNEFQEIMRAETSLIGKPLLIAWLYTVEAMELPEFRDCTRACRNWFTEILNSIDYPWSNGFTEGCNNKTKVLKRVCFGVRNFKRFRNRILHCAN